MPRPPPQPIFVHRGLEGGAVSCAVVSTSEGTASVLVGSGKGRCELFDAETHVHLRTVYVDDEARAISSVGSFGDCLLVHVRNHAIILLEADGTHRVELKLSHCGYCRMSVIDRWIAYPDTENERHYIRFWTDEQKSRNEILLKNLPLSMVCVDDTIFVGDEAGTLLQISPDEGVQKEVSLFSEPVFCVAATPSSVACGSAKPPIQLLSTSDIAGSRRSISYPPSARGAGSVAFSSSGKTLLAGFWDGSLRAFSVKKLTVLLYLDFHSESISQILWTKVNDEDRVAVASSDEKLSLWVF